MMGVFSTRFIVFFLCTWLSFFIYLFLTTWKCSGNFCTRERGVWLGLSDVDSPGKLLWVNGSEAQDGEEGQQPRSSISGGNVCVSFDQSGQTSSHLCDSKRAYVCQYNPHGMLTHTPSDHMQRGAVNANANSLQFTSSTKLQGWLYKFSTYLGCAGALNITAKQSKCRSAFLKAPHITGAQIV